MWNAIAANPDAVLLLATTLLGLFGVGRWRQATSQATADQVDRWASTAADAMALAIRSGLLGSNEAALSWFRDRFRALAAAAGVRLTPELENRALGVAHEQLVMAAQSALETNLAKLGDVAAHLVASMSTLPKAP